VSGTLNCFVSFLNPFPVVYIYIHQKPSPESAAHPLPYFAPNGILRRRRPPHISRHGIACQCEEMPFGTVRSRIDGRKNAKSLHGLVITTDLTRSSVAISLHSRSKSILIVEMAAAQLLQDIDGVRNCFRAEEVIYLLLQFLPTTSD
jgi:hypothetical protein